MITIEKALEIIENSKVSPQEELIAVSESCGRILSADIISSIDIPQFNKSRMDGYAINSQDDLEFFEIIEVIHAGIIPEKTLNKGQCSKIMTGAVLPKGANKVVRVEYTEEIDKKVFIKKNDDDNVVMQGNYLKKGAKVLDKGTLVKPKEIAVLSSLGLSKIFVYKKAVVGLIITGDELTEPGNILPDGKIYDSNGVQLRAQIESVCAKCNYYGILKDDKQNIKIIIEKALSECDVVLVSGGMSMGEKDYIIEILKELSVDIKFSKVAVKPGKPLLFGEKQINEKSVFVFGIPGNPVSSFISFEIFVKPLIYKCMGYNLKPVWYAGELKEEIKRTNADRDEFIPIYFDGKNIYPLNYKASDHITSLINANAIIRINKGVFEIQKGKILDVRPI
jgi:molybdopterin molybdotransferase